MILWFGDFGFVCGFAVLGWVGLCFVVVVGLLLRVYVLSLGGFGFCGCGIVVVWFGVWGCLAVLGLGGFGFVFVFGGLLGCFVGLIGCFVVGLFGAVWVGCGFGVDCVC